MSLQGLSMHATENEVGVGSASLIKQQVFIWMVYIRRSAAWFAILTRPITHVCCFHPQGKP